MPANDKLKRPRTFKLACTHEYERHCGHKGLLQPVSSWEKVSAWHDKTDQFLCGIRTKLAWKAFIFPLFTNEYRYGLEALYDNPNRIKNMPR